MKPFRIHTLLSLALVLGSLVPSANASPQIRADEMPSQLTENNVQLEDRIGSQVNGDLTFRRLNEQPVKMWEFFQEDRPILLTMNYASCPKLCGVQLGELARALGSSSMEPGKDYEMITVSLDPEEEAIQTQAVKDGFLTKFDREIDAKAWHFLRGSEEDIRALADAVGFQYAKDEDTGEYMHPALAMVLSPTGKLMRHVGGLTPDKKDLRLAIKDAAVGKKGPGLGDRFLLFCYSYNSTTGQYTFAAWRLLRAGAVLTIVFLAAGFWKLQHSRAREENQS